MSELTNEIVTTENTETTAVEEVTNKPGSGLSYLDGKELNRVYKNAQVLAKSSLLPQRYQGKAEDIMILMDMCSRMGISLFALAKGTYPVHGEISVTGQFCIQLINGSGKFTPLDFVFVGEEGTDDFGCYAIAKRKPGGAVCKSTVITIGMAKAEGWIRNSKWKTMTTQMMMYRAASFFMRVYCPELTLGMYTQEELEDVYGAEEPKQKQKTRITLNSVKPDVVVDSEVEDA